MVRKRILERYERSDDGAVIIDVSASRVEDLYEDFDKSAPYYRKDLDDDLAFYLTGCAREIGRSRFVLRFTFDDMPQEELRERVRTSLHKFFMYRRELEVTELKSMLRTSLLLLVLGTVLLVLSLLPASFFPGAADGPIIGRLLEEGLTIAAWVSIWESMATFLVNWRPRRQKIFLNERIASATVLFQASRLQH